jgi:hypothetical protein
MADIVFDIPQFEDLYDSANAKIQKDLQDQYDCKKINGATYADVWSKLMGTMLQSVIGAIVNLQSKETDDDRCVKQATCTKLTAEANFTDAKTTEVPLNGTVQREVQTAQKELYIRQKEGFDDNKNQKLYEAQLNAWAVVFTDSNLECMQPSLYFAAVNESYETISGIEAPEPPTGSPCEGDEGEGGVTTALAMPTPPSQ